PDRSLLGAWSRGRTVFNTYGPTETTVNASSFLFADKGVLQDLSYSDKENVPIGKAIPGTRIYILEGNSLSGVCVPGELCIAGAQVSRGYHKRQELTAEKFISDPFGEGRMYRSGDIARFLPDGNIEFMERMDDQVKLRGYRIELGEIETALRSANGVKNAAVVIRRSGAGQQLCGYFVPETPYTDTKKIRVELEKKLPAYMVPGALIPLDELPLTINGKLDKRALPAPVFEDAGEYVPPATREEADCCKVFSEVLKISRIGVTDDYLALGGDSIKAIRIISRLKDMGYRVDTASLLKVRTIRRLAALIQKEKTADYREYRHIRPTPVMKLYKKADMPVPEHYNQSVILKFDKSADKERLKIAFEGLIKTHGMLRFKVSGDSMEILEPDAFPAFEIPVYEGRTDAERIKIMDDLQSRMDPGSGVVIKTALFTDNECDRLFIAIHHYSVDEVSWDIIIKDLNDLYDKPGEKLSLARTVSFGEWSERLWAYKDSAAFYKEKRYWEKIHNDIDTNLDGYRTWLDGFKRADKKASRGFGYITEEIDSQTTWKLLDISAGRYHSRPDVLILATLILSLNDVNRAGFVIVQLEGHGRGNIGDDISTERTVGWFTSVYPLAIPVAPTYDGQAEILKELLTSVPNAGIGYGLLYDDLNDIQGMIFNYLGEEETDGGSGIFRCDEPSGREINELNGDPGTISFNIKVIDSRLRIECCHDRAFDKESIKRLLTAFIKRLQDAAESLNPAERLYSPGDICVGGVMDTDEWKELTGKYDPETLDAVSVLTPLQQGMFYRYISDPGTGAYVLQDRLTIDGGWDRDSFIKALKLLHIRYDALRIRFLYKGFSEPWQVIPGWESTEPDYREVSKKTTGQIAKEDLELGFDLTKDAPFRVTFNKDTEAGDKNEILLTMHHCIADGWSFPIMISALMRYYRELKGGSDYEELKASVSSEASAGCSYSDYLRLYDGTSRGEALEKWRTYLQGVRSGTGMDPVPPKAKDRQGASYARYELAAELGSRIREYTAANRITAGSFFSVLWGLLIGFENDERDIVFGEVVSGRSRGIKGIEEAVGMFINTVPVRVKAEPESRVRDIMRQRQEDRIALQPYEDTALSEIKADGESITGLIRTIFVYENYPDEADDISDHTVELQHEEVDYPISVSIEEREGFFIEIQYEASLYDESYIKKLLQRMSYLASQIVGDEAVRVKELDRITDDEKKNLPELMQWQTEEFPKLTFPEILLENAKKHTGKTALMLDDKSLDYGSLINMAATVSNELGCGDERFIAVMTGRRIEAVVAMTAVMLSGAAYVPIDPDYPDERIDHIIGDCAPEAVLYYGDDSSAERTEIFKKRGVRTIDVLEVCKSPDPVKLPVLPDDIRSRVAYMIYTSGTSGVPKGVEIEHAALSGMIFSNKKYYGCFDGIVLQLANQVFDASVQEIFVTLACGGCVCLIPKEKMISAGDIAAYCRQHKADVIIATNALMQALSPEEFGRMKMVCVGGDTALLSVFDRWSGHTDMLVNDYGPTEACVNAVVHRYDRDEDTDTIPIGRPYANRRIYILQGDKPCGMGQTGEICIGGNSLARGYHNDPDLTAKSFVKEPFGEGRMYRTGDTGFLDANGEIRYIGRKDGQIKIRGFRIETGEIESRIREYEGIEQTAVTAIHTHGAEPYIAAFVTSKEKIDTEGVKAHLSAYLPAYMIPRVVSQVDEIPLNASGKVDERKLSLSIADIKEAYIPPEGYYEELVAGLYSKILGVESVGRNDSFFELGASSIDLMKLISALGVYGIGIEDVTAKPTPALLAGVMMGDFRDRQDNEGGLMRLQDGSGEYASIFCLPPSGGMSLCYMPLIKELGYKGRVYGLTDSKYRKLSGMTFEELKAYDPGDKDLWQETVDDHYRKIKGVFRDGDILIGYSQGGISAFIIAKKLEEAGHRVGHLIMLESEAPDADGIEDPKDSDRAARLKAAAAIFTGRSMGSVGEYMTRRAHSSEEEFFRGYLRELWGNDSEKTLLRGIYETYLVYSVNVLHNFMPEGKTNTGIYSVSLSDEDGTGTAELSEKESEKWAEHTRGGSRGYVIQGSPDDHLVFLSKYRDRIARIINSLL
ncbi:MAG: amino acid adenylation domain-containing protein, partial [Lachnospiraceae bacterium]|nr:amino acid adenylation domain-containing protein [Lachnospiraceae bacterium]